MSTPPHLDQATSSNPLAHKLQAIISMINDGLDVILCHWEGEEAKRPIAQLHPNGHKTPLRDIKDAANALQRFPHAMIGAAVPEGYVVFDIDPRNGGSLEALEAATGPLPQTRTTISGRNDGGKHPWFKLPDGVKLSSRHVPKGVDMKQNGYLIMPPSIHPATGEPYRLEVPNAPVAELPTTAIEALNAPKHPQPSPSVTQLMQQPPQTVADLLAGGGGSFTAGLVRAVQEATVGERNNTLYWAACRALDDGQDHALEDLHAAGVGVGLTPEEAHRTIESARETDRQQPDRFDPQDVQTVRDAISAQPAPKSSPNGQIDAPAQAAASTATGQPTYPERFPLDVAAEAYRLRIREAARDLITKEQQPPLELPVVHDLDDFLAVEDDPVQYVVDELFPVGAQGILAAQYKAGKTTLIGNLIRSLVDGDDFLNRFPVNRQSRVTLIDNELDPRTLRRWLRDQGIRNTDRVRLVSLRGKVSTFNLIDDDIRAQWVNLVQDPGIVLLDCLRPILDALGLDENREAGRFLVAYEEFLADVGATETMLVHHMGHSGERSRGDSRLQDWPDMTWSLNRKNEDPASERFFKAFGRDVNVPEASLSFDPLTRHLTLGEGNRKTANLEHRLTRVLVFLNKSPRTVKTGILKHLGGGKDLTTDALAEALRRGLIEEGEKLGQGGGTVYELTEKGKQEVRRRSAEFTD
jgi:hypothetical protein